MVVKVEEIREHGLELNEPIPARLLEEALAERGADLGFRAVGASPLHANLSKVSGSVLLKADFTAQLVCPCKRCVDEVALVVPVAFILNLVPKDLVKAEKDGLGDDDGSSERAGSFGIGEIDQELFDGKTIDLDPILREQVLLALPLSVVCGEDCKGLCPVCGQDLNEKECGCDRKVVDARLAALKNIKLN